MEETGTVVSPTILLIKEIETKVNVLNDKIVDTLKVYKDYCESLRDEKFEEIPKEKEKDTIKRVESIIDRLDERIKRNELTKEKRTETIELFNKMMKLFDRISEYTELEKEELANKNNELIDVLIEIEERKTNALISQNPKRTGTYIGMFTDKKDELNQQKINTKKFIPTKNVSDRKVSCLQLNSTPNRLNFNEVRQIEEWTQLKLENIIFDSNIDNWSKGQSVFDIKMFRREHFIFIIEDDEGNKFGGYVDARIDDYERVNDPKSFIFSIKQNGRLNGMFKFDTECSNSFYLINQQHNLLFALGNEAKGIWVYKENNKTQSYCYKQLLNCDEPKKFLQKTFTPLRITFVQLIDEKSEQERMGRMNGVIDYNEMKQIEEWTKMKVGNVIFDSDIDDWKKGTSVFEQKISNNKKLIFLIEDEDGNLFGGYFSANIFATNHLQRDSTGFIVYDLNAFIFSLRSNGRLNGMLKFHDNESKFSIRLWKQSQDCLFSFGVFSFGGSDITIYKENNKTQSYCQPSFDYNNFDYALCGKRGFTPKRIVVIQMV